MPCCEYSCYHCYVTLLSCYQFYGGGTQLSQGAWLPGHSLEPPLLRFVILALNKLMDLVHIVMQDHGVLPSRV